MKAVFERASQELEEKHGIVLVTIVDSSGSAPRKTGSCMVVNADGQLAGTIGGGNIEYRSEQYARELVADKASHLHSFNLNEKDTENIGMRCGGDVDVWFQYISPADDAWADIMRQLMGICEHNQGGWLIQSLTGSEPALLSPDKELLAGSMPDDIEMLCVSSCVRTDKFYSMPLPKKERVIIFGGGHVCQALVPVLASVDFAPVVFDDRPEFTDPALFPCATATILGDYQAISDYVELGPDDYVVIMTHNHTFDFEIQAQALSHELAYLGAIGSARKTRTFHERLRDMGFSEEKIDFVHMPIGTKISADTPAEIAVSIVGEMISVRAERRAATE